MPKLDMSGIRSHGKGWQVTVSGGRNPLSGKRLRVYEVVYGSASDAVRRRDELRVEVTQKRHAQRARLTLGEYLVDSWLPHIRIHVEATTFQRYERAVLKHIVPKLGHLRLEDLEVRHVRGFVDWLVTQGRLDGKGGLGPKAVRNVYRVLAQSLGQAETDGLIRVNPARAKAVRLPRVSKTDIYAIDGPTAERILEAATGTKLEVEVVLALGAGLRRGEVLGLRWQDVDLDDSTLRVCQAVKAMTGPLTIGKPKNGKQRSLSVSPWVAETLRRHRADQAARRLSLGAAWHDLDLVCDRGDGRPKHPNAVSRAFGELMDKAGLPKVTFHGLRHGQATLLYSLGVDLKTTSERLGHANIGITADLYTHVLKDMDRKAADALSGLWNGVRVASES